ncbi:MAG TPA: dihydrodipicolinate synthase family protein, partial [Balneolaceae bacterium]|nr:dihydrodipicolinate synthase family protein [Balneolaceae bacterium]
YTRHLLEELPLPALLYNNPSLTKVAFQLEPLRDLLQHPGIAGFKDSSGDLVYFHKLKKMADSRDIPLFVGPEELLMDVLVMGGAGGVPGGANIFPSLYVDLFDSVKAGDISRGRTLHQKIMQLSETVYGMTAYGSSDITGGIKAALSLLDVCGSHVSAPLQNVSRERARLIEAFITKQTSDDE